jgi:hypothetical protein
MPFCGNEQDRAQQHRVVLAGGNHEKKTPGGKGDIQIQASGAVLRNKHWAHTTTTQRTVQSYCRFSDVHGEVRRESSAPDS